MAGKEYNFDYFDRMNQKEKEAKQKQPAASQSAGPPARERTVRLRLLLPGRRAGQPQPVRRIPQEGMSGNASGNGPA